MGKLRYLVMGLGTGAVDRVQGSYPRLVNLDRPLMTTAVTSREKHQFSQRKIDVIDTIKGLVEGKDLSWVEGKLPFYLKRLLLEHDRDTEADFRNREQDGDILFVSCESLSAGLFKWHMTGKILQYRKTWTETVSFWSVPMIQWVCQKNQTGLYRHGGFRGILSDAIQRQSKSSKSRRRG